MPLYAHHYIISGRGQRRGRFAGCDGVIAQFDRYRRPGVRIESFVWNADWRDEAAFIALHAPSECEPIVCIYAYSWGFGWGAIRLAQELHKLNIDVYGMRVCDGVYRHPYPWGNWRAFDRSSIVRLPRNVPRDRVQLFVQTNTLLRGHRVVDWLDREVKAMPVTHVDCSLGAWNLHEPATHGNMDESREWRNACCELADEVDWVMDAREQLALGGIISI